WSRGLRCRECDANSITVLSVKPMPRRQTLCPHIRARYRRRAHRDSRHRGAADQPSRDSDRLPFAMPMAAVTLPEEVRAPMGDFVLDTLVDRGLAVRRFSAAAQA